MAASVRVEDEAFGDGRYDHLGQLLGTSKYDALGRMAFLWRQCTQEHSHVLPESFVRVFVDPDLLCEARLGERVGDGIRIKGTRGRIEWLARLRKNGKKGGRPRKATENHLVSKNDNKQKPGANPPAPAPAPTNKEEEAPAPPPLVLVPDEPKAKSPQAQLTDLFFTRFEAAYGQKPTWSEKQAGQIATLLTKHSLSELVARMEFMFAGRVEWPKPPYTLDSFVSNIDRFIDAPRQQSKFQKIPKL